MTTIAMSEVDARRVVRMHGLYGGPEIPSEMRPVAAAMNGGTFVLADVFCILNGLCADLTKAGIGDFVMEDTGHGIAIVDRKRSTAAVVLFYKDVQ